MAATVMAVTVAATGVATVAATVVAIAAATTVPTVGDLPVILRQRLRPAPHLQPARPRAPAALRSPPRSGRVPHAHRRLAPDA
eukprot:4582242-Pleurochrysis_carterae.AAC.2